MKAKTLLTVGLAALVVYAMLRKKKSAADTWQVRPADARATYNDLFPTRVSTLPDVIRSHPSISSGSVISNTGGASQGMVLPSAAAAQRDTELYGYGSGS